MRSALETTATALLVIAALLVATAAVHREFFGPSGQDSAAAATYIEDWEDLINDGILIGSSDAPVKIIEFADLQCPFCKRFHEAYGEVRKTYEDDVALVFMHYPLEMHDMARPSARAAECAQLQNGFAGFIDVVFEKQDSLGIKSWESYAEDAEISDPARLGACVVDTTSFTRIERGREIGSDIGVGGTPTVLINGWLLATAPYSTLADAIERVLAGDPPVEDG